MSVIAVVDCLRKRSTRYGDRDNYDWVSAPLLQACWRVYPARAGHLLGRSVKLPASERASLLKAHRNKRTALEYAFLVENWSKRDIEAMSYPGSEMWHFLGIRSLPLENITRPRLGRLSKVANTRFPASNPWETQAQRISRRKNLSPRLRRGLQYMCPRVLIDESISAAELWEILNERASQNCDGTSLHEAACLNSNISEAEAVAVMATFGQSFGDRLSMEGMRQLSATRGNQSSFIDATVIALVRFSKRAEARAEVVMREVVEADGFNQQHFDYLAASSNQSLAPIALCAWSGASERDVMHLISSCSTAEQPAAAYYALQNPNLTAETLRTLAGQTGGLAALDAWTISQGTKVPSSMLDASIDRMVARLDPATFGAILALPELETHVLIELLERGHGLIHQTDGVSPSALSVMFAERESIGQEVWDVLSKHAWRITEDEKTAAIARLDVPQSLSEQFLQSTKESGAALAAALSPVSCNQTRAFALEQLSSRDVSSDIADLLREHVA